ncbi:MAG: 2-oxoacid:acceptor oxidoreductase subunit alpha, partial [Alicyclobacillaceae bacterium]|nr:2-oxoacid:acceptor oxidoreductase subunit alpha [Alicyclobacillaceae bacterium]
STPIHPFPLSELASQAGSNLARNMVALGATARLFRLPLDPFLKEVERRFQSKGERIVHINCEAARLGYDAMAQHADNLAQTLAVPQDARDGSVSSTMLLATGNEAIAYGALVGGCRFFSGYPITPATPILEWLAKRLPEFGGTVVQAEDEIAALCMVIGAGYAGVRAMTATSGPGISLMTESFGLAAMTETPVVIVNVQRPGPSAGQPTKHEQSDIEHVVYAGHGDLSRIVLSPGTVSDCFEDAWRAFNLAERYQCPVFILLDQDLALRKQTIAPFPLNEVRIDRGRILDEEGLRRLEESGAVYERFALTPDSISPRVLPGTPGGVHIVSGDEHFPSGKIDVFDPKVRAQMAAKRVNKLKTVPDELRGCVIHGNPAAEAALVTIGSVTGVGMEACQILESRTGLSWKVVQLRLIHPFPARQFLEAVQNTRVIVVVDQNVGGQLKRLIFAQGLPLPHVTGVRKHDGEPYRPDELANDVQKELKEIGEGTGSKIPI